MPSYFKIAEKDGGVLFEARRHDPEADWDISCEWELDEAEEIGWALLGRVNKIRKEAING